jgi:hypothetical protein
MMIRRLLSLPSVAAALLIPALSGCAYLQKSTPPPASITTQTPAILAPPLTPLDMELSQNSPPLPDLPAPPPPGAQPAPPPASMIAETAKKPAHTSRRRGRKLEVEVAERETHEREAREKEAAANAAAAAPDTNPPAEGQTAKVTAPTPKGETTQPTSIGQLTAAATPDSSGARQQAADLIDTTQRGVNSLHNLNGDQTKTVAQIRSFLDQAQRALHNGDLDGAHTLATKAKTLLDELTGAS